MSAKMTTWTVQREGARIDVKAGALAVYVDDKLVQQQRCEQLKLVHVFGPVEISAKARGLMFRHQLEVMCFDRGGRYLGQLIGPERATAPRRLAQYKALLDEPTRLRLAREVVSAKLHNQRILLMRQHRRQAHEESARAITGLRQLMGRLGQLERVEQLMGCEGHGSALYYRGLARGILNADFSFERRTRRPPEDAFNACLSFGYTLLLGRVESACRLAGLDPQLGALHEAQAGKPSLALDLMEPWRPLIDQLVMRMVNRRQLSAQDFERPPRPEAWERSQQQREEDQEDAWERAVYLAASGRAVFIPEMYGLWRGVQREDERGQQRKLEDILAHQVLATGMSFEEGSPRLHTWLWR